MSDRKHPLAFEYSYLGLSRSRDQRVALALRIAVEHGMMRRSAAVVRLHAVYHHGVGPQVLEELLAQHTVVAEQNEVARRRAMREQLAKQSAAIEAARTVELGGERVVLVHSDAVGGEHG